MLNFFPQSLIRLLIVILAISPAQITMAIDLDQPDQNMIWQFSPALSQGSIDTNMDDSCTLENSGHCFDISVCASHSDLTSMRPSTSLLLSPAVITLLSFTGYNESMPTNYPGLLKRPPKTQSS